MWFSYRIDMSYLHMFIKYDFQVILSFYIRICAFHSQNPALLCYKVFIDSQIALYDTFMIRGVSKSSFISIFNECIVLNNHTVNMMAFRVRCRSMIITI
uniref:Ovule protein n=1 Tax=Heterorhabditis bacteriophora TaxID=37862 RepID=A0A1I7X0R6_HETBA